MRLASAMLIAILLAATAHAQPTSSPGGWRMGPGMMRSGMMGPAMTSGGYGMMGWLSQYSDGYIAFLKTELKITPAQEGAFSKLADALRKQAGQAQTRGPGWMMGRGGYGPGMMSGGTAAWQPHPLPDALDQEVAAAQQRLNSLKAMRDAAKPLYAKLTDDQKSMADRLLSCPMCGW